MKPINTTTTHCLHDTNIAYPVIGCSENSENVMLYSSQDVQKWVRKRNRQSTRWVLFDSECWMLCKTKQGVMRHGTEPDAQFAIDCACGNVCWRLPPSVDFRVQVASILFDHAMLHNHSHALVLPQHDSNLATRVGEVGYFIFHNLRCYYTISITSANETTYCYEADFTSLTTGWDPEWGDDSWEDFDRWRQESQVRVLTEPLATKVERIIFGRRDTLRILTAMNCQKCRERR
ncbi:MAG: hypothetical protein LBG70_04580 [Bifidobacteriaceae bacterium]|jgi:hypothetical protein|nr:hypothetical protein [Bifidobacteriaceae bacterium]